MSPRIFPLFLRSIWMLPTLWLTGLASAQPVLIADLNAETRSDAAQWIVDAADDSLIFISGEPDIPELWVSDGTLEGTRFWAEACPGACEQPADARLAQTARFDGQRAYWVADDGIHGNEIWTSDGTPEGTHLVADICPGRCSSVSRHSNLTLIDGRLFFSASTPDTGMEPWVTDGTLGGTKMLGDLRFDRGSSPYDFFPFDDGVVFRAFSEDDQVFWWWTDGTAAGTQIIADLCEGEDCEFPIGRSAVLGDAFYTLSRSGGVPSDLRIYRMRTDSASEMLFSCQTCFGSSTEPKLVVGHQRLLFQALETLYEIDEHGVEPLPAPPGGGKVREVFVIDGNTELVLVEDFNFIHSLYRLNGKTWTGPLLEQLEGQLVAEAFDDHVRIALQEPYDLSLWRSDGTTQGTSFIERVEDLDVSLLFGSAAIGDHFLFKTSGAEEELWVSGETAGTAQRLFGGTERPRSSNPVNAASLGAVAVFGTDPVLERGDVLATDGTAAGTTLLLPGVDLLSSEPVHTPDGPRLLLSARDETAWALPWLTDGTAAGTRQLGFADSGPAYVREPVHLGDQLYFLADRSVGQQLWRTDGSVSGTEMIFDLYPEWYNGHTERFFVYPRELRRLPTPNGDRLVFIANPQSTGTEVWHSDGTAAGTGVVADLYPGPQSSDPEHLTVVGDRAYWTADDGSGRALWTWSAGTTVVSLGLVGQVLTAHELAGRLIWFEQRDGTVALMSTDGQSISQVAEYAGAVGDEWIVTDDHRLFFVLADDRGAELWKSDGTAEGTGRVADLWPSARGSYPHNLRLIDDALYFSAEHFSAEYFSADGRSGQQLWRLSLPTLTVSQAASIDPGAIGSAPREMVKVGDHLVFSADNEEHGRELWAVSTTTPRCEPTEFTRCLRDGRFSVSVRWKVTESGEEGLARVLLGTDDSAFYWFFSDANLELIVKVLDGVGINDHHWLFYGSLSNVEYWIEAKDHQTGTTRIFHNPPLELCGDADTRAFPEPLDGFGPGGSLDLPSMTQAPAKALTCEPSHSRLCLLDRFAVSVDWQTSEGSGVGTALPFTDETGLFWFFDDQNIELAVKVLDARDINDRFWVFFGALSDVAYQIKVVDTLTGAEKVYHNPQGNLCGQSDTDAFPGS